MALAMTALAQDEPTRLRYAVPAGWTPSLDGKSLLPPGGGATVTFGPSAPFDGSAVQWMARNWDEIAAQLTLLSGPAPGNQGPFLSRIGLFRQADGPQFWLCLNTRVEYGRGESVVLIAASDEVFRAHLPALGRMLLGSTVAPPTATSAGSAAPATPGAAPRAGAAATTASADSPAGVDPIAGLYFASTSQYRINPLGPPGSGSMEWRTEFYLLSVDGRVFRGPDLPAAPGGDISRFDYDAARREAPAASGSWTTQGRDVVLRMGAQPVETLVGTRPEPGVLEIRGTRFKRSIPGRSP